MSVLDFNQIKRIDLGTGRYTPPSNPLAYRMARTALILLRAVHSGFVWAARTTFRLALPVEQAMTLYGPKPILDMEKVREGLARARLQEWENTDPGVLSYPDDQQTATILAGLKLAAEEIEPGKTPILRRLPPWWQGRSPFIGEGEDEP